MTTAVLDVPEIDVALAQVVLDTMVVEDPGAAETESSVFEMELPIRPALPLHEVVRSNGGSGRRLEARWVPDPRGEQALICIWVPPSGSEASEMSPDLQSVIGF